MAAERAVGYASIDSEPPALKLLPVVLFDHLRHAGDERCIPDEA